MTDWRANLVSAIETGSGPDLEERPRSDDILRAEAVLWLASTAEPALKEVAAELRGLDRRVEITRAGADSLAFVVRTRAGVRELDLKFRIRPVRTRVQVYARELVREGHREFVREWPLEAELIAVTAADVIAFVVERYRAGREGASGAK